MGCQDSFKTANYTTIVCFFLVIVAQVSSWIAMTTTSWSTVSLPFDTDGDDHYGLWRKCKSKLITGCITLDGWGDTTYAIVQGFACVGFMSLNLGHLVMLLFIFVDRWRKVVETGTAAAVLLISAAFLWSLCLVIYAFGYSQTGAIYGYSFGFGAVAAGTSLITGLTLIVAARI